MSRASMYVLLSTCSFHLHYLVYTYVDRYEWHLTLYDKKKYAFVKVVRYLSFFKYYLSYFLRKLNIFEIISNFLYYKKHLSRYLSDYM